MPSREQLIQDMMADMMFSKRAKEKRDRIVEKRAAKLEPEFVEEYDAKKAYEKAKFSDAGLAWEMDVNPTDEELRRLQQWANKTGARSYSREGIISPKEQELLCERVIDLIGLVFIAKGKIEEYRKELGIKQEEQRQNEKRSAETDADMTRFKGIFDNED